MPEAVIVATCRTAIGRAHKGSSVDVRPKDLSRRAVKHVDQSGIDTMAAIVERLS